MNVEAAPSFFKSLKNIGSIKDKYYQIRSWFRYHFKKDFRHLLMVVLKSYPWDEMFLYYIEQAKIQEMMNYHKKYQRFVGWEQVVRDMQICYNLIDIFTEKKELFNYTGNLKFVPVENSDNVEIKDDNLTYHCLVNVNTKNADRFLSNIPDDAKKYYIEHPHELYIVKAKYLYHKIRLERDGKWWD